MDLLLSQLLRVKAKVHLRSHTNIERARVRGNIYRKGLKYGIFFSSSEGNSCGKIELKQGGSLMQ